MHIYICVCVIEYVCMCVVECVNVCVVEYVYVCVLCSGLRILPCFLKSSMYVEVSI